MFKFIEYYTEVLAWIWIVVSFSLLGGIVGALLYFIIADTAALIIGIIIGIAGIITGLYLAIKAWRTTGTVNFISGVAKNRWPYEKNTETNEEE